MYDIIFTNCRVIDGSGAPWQRKDVAVKDGVIVRIGKLIPDEKMDDKAYLNNIAFETVDCEDLYLAPGFIDIHSHSDYSIQENPKAESRILQGITTELTGNCGMSAYPVSDDPDKRKMLRDYIGDLDYSWRGVGSFLENIEEKVRPSVNMAFAVGHGSIRIAVMGFDERDPSREELNSMKDILAESLEEGAFCMTSGLIYPPGCYSRTPELTELSKVLARFGSQYQTHMRNEGPEVVESVKEALTIAEESGAALQISHHKVLYEPNWNSLCYKTTELIEKAREDGIDVQCDQYPYLATATSLGSNVPNKYFEGGVEAMLDRISSPGSREEIVEVMNENHKGRWHNISVSYVDSDDLKWVVGKNMVDIGKEMGKDPASACLDILIASKDRAGEVNLAISEEDLEYIMKKPYVMVGSDGEAKSLDYEGKPHPRAYGAFARVISYYCRARKLFPLEEAVRKMTSMPAARIGLEDRGLIKEGNKADMVLFDFDKIEDTPTYADPVKACKGIRRVYVNGILTAKDGRHTGARAGSVLRRR
jgi:N-acyl-D-amino-acid deacylase